MENLGDPQPQVLKVISKFSRNETHKTSGQKSIVSILLTMSYKMKSRKQTDYKLHNARHV